MEFNHLLSLLDENLDEKAFQIKGKSKKVVGLAEFRTINMGEDGYFKMMFDDHSFMLVIPSMGSVFYADRILGKADGISDEMIGNVAELEFNDKKYKLENKDDFQYTVRLFIGGPEDIEGEVKFSDYGPVDGSVEILSLGWITRTGERADINCKEIALERIQVV